MANPGAQKYTDYPLKIVGSTVFGRYKKISVEQTYNMMITDDALVNFAGWKMINSVNPQGVGRGIYSSSNLKKLFAVIDNTILMYDTNLTRTIIGKMGTFVGDVFISENNNGEVAFSDNLNLYVYGSLSNTMFTLTNTQLGFTPGYITFQNTRLISPNIASSTWRLSDFNSATTVADWPSDSQHEGALQTKPDKTVATIRFPGRGNLLLVMGSTVCELWNDVGSVLFPYQRNQSINLDYGCLNPATIAESENIVCFLAANEKSGPSIMYTNGGDLTRISTDGIDYLLQSLEFPSNAYGFMFRQDGHLFYVITFVKDNLSYAYDFTAEKFYSLADENMNAFIVKRIAFFNDKYYFVSIRDGNLYELSSQFTTYDYGNDEVFEIPRIRITASISQPDQSRFVAGYSGFTIEQGQFDYPDVDTRFNLNTQDGSQILTQDDAFILSGGEDFTANVPKINLSLSKDGGVNFGSKWAKFLNPLGRRANRLMWYQLGAANELVHQFEFFGFQRFVAKEGVCGVME
jgi:hypothetical protein